MLCLSRKPGEQIVVTTASGDEIVFTLLEIDRNKARIGIDADLSVVIVRRELLPVDTGEHVELGEAGA